MCVVALLPHLPSAGGWRRRGENVPEGVADDEEGHVGLVGAAEDLVARALDHFAVGDEDGAAVEGFLLARQCGQFPDGNWEKTSYQFLLADHQDGGVGLEVDALGALDHLEAADGDVLLVREAEADEVEHG